MLFPDTQKPLPGTPMNRTPPLVPPLLQPASDTSASTDKHTHLTRGTSNAACQRKHKQAEDNLMSWKPATEFHSSLNM